MEASSPSLNFRSPTGRVTGRKPGWAIPELVRLRKNHLKNRYLPLRLCLATANGGVRVELNGIGDGDGVIIVDHGSRRQESNLMLNEFVEMFREKTKYRILEPAHMELAEPSIKDAFGLCVQQGAHRIIVSPFFLFPGRHWHQVSQT
ncbi:sirohydrochlorin ferrochelatase, chloroplastic [Olea europaea subsp. europaea]|uniref:Sirohydrochlorin ferrochelatase, chloroplastic n=1 Tax=Olea europaea subsp. europaea TaxID=158383 RepID=A0A8S0SWY1_OLEEU|nr:sirohydrochlorin ferrochelatase, chloroplastic [Olea europaea subsp. europaea]